jgi:serine protease Do
MWDRFLKVYRDLAHMRTSIDLARQALLKSELLSWRVVVTWNSGALAAEGNLTVGNVSALHGLADDPKDIQITTPVQARNGGGPLLDRNGNVIGVVAAKLNAIRSLGILIAPLVNRQFV